MTVYDIVRPKPFRSEEKSLYLKLTKRKPKIYEASIFNKYCYQVPSKKKFPIYRRYDGLVLLFLSACVSAGGGGSAGEAGITGLQLFPYTHIESGEDGLRYINTNATPGYGVFCDRIKADSFTHSFRLFNLGINPMNQWVQLKNTYFPSASSYLNFLSMMGFSGDAESAIIEISVNGGSWFQLPGYQQVGSNNFAETSFSPKSISLSAYANQSIELRFKYVYNGAGNTFWQEWDVNNQTPGWYFDRIEVTNTLNSVPMEDVEETFPAENIHSLGTYDVITTRFSAEDRTYSLRLLNLGLGTITDRYIQLKSSLVPSVNSVLKYQSRLAMAGLGESIAAQVSLDNGVHWENLPGSLQYGLSINVSGETSFSQKILSLADYTGQTIRIRFVMKWSNLNSYVYQDWINDAGRTSGWFLDQIEVTNANEWRAP